MPKHSHSRLNPKVCFNAVLLALLIAGCTLAAPKSWAIGRHHVTAPRRAIPTRLSVVERQALSSRPAGVRKKKTNSRLSRDQARAQLAFKAMQKHFYMPRSKLYRGEPLAILWGFSQAFAATVSMANIPGNMVSFRHEIEARLVGLRSYLDTSESSQPEEPATSTVPAFGDRVAPPSGPGGPAFFDDNDWVGIELARVYAITHIPSALESAEQIMAFEMSGWARTGQLACPGGIPFNVNSTSRTATSNAPAVELGVQLYEITHQIPYLRFAELDYEWMRNCLLQPTDLYADTIRPHGEVEHALLSYNQGTMIGAGALLYQATGNSGYLYQARQTAKAALAYFTVERLDTELPFFPSVYFRNLLYLDSVTRDPPGQKLVQGYADHAWQSLRLSDNLFSWGSPHSVQLLVQSAIVQIYALLSSPPNSYF
jgi:hypothetical protein